MNDSLDRTPAWLPAVAMLWSLLACLSGLWPHLRLWGVNHLGFVPWPLTLGLVLLIVGTWIPKFARVLQRLAARAVHVALNGRGYTLVLIPLVFAAGLFAVRSATSLLGDGQLIANSYSDAFESRTPDLSVLLSSALEGEWIATGTSMAFHLVIWVVRQFGDVSPLLVIQSFHAVLGGIWLALLLAFLRRHRQAPESALGIVGLYLCGGGIVLFAGYLEYYTLLHLLLTGYVMAVISAVRYQRPLWPAVAWLTAAVTAHVQACLFAPALIYVMVLRTRPTATPVRYRQTAWVVAIGSLLIATGARWIAPFAVHYLPLYSGDHTYAVLSSAHLLDVFNELTLLLPLLPLVAVGALLLRTRRAGQRAANQDSGTEMSVHSERVLWLMILPCLLYLLLFKPDLGMARDWDLFAMLALPVVPLIVERSGATGRAAESWSPVQWAGTIGLATALVLTTGWIYVNADWKASATRLEHILQYDDSRADYAYENLAILYEAKGDLDRATQRMSQAYEITGSLRHMHRLVEYLERSGRPREAIELLRRRIVSHPDEHKPLIQLMMILDRAGAVEDFLAAARDGCRRFPGRYSFWYLRGQAAFRLGLLSEGVQSFTHALELNPAPSDRASMELNLRELRARGMWPSDSAALAVPER